MGKGFMREDAGVPRRAIRQEGIGPPGDRLACFKRAVTALFPPHDRWVNGAAWHGNKFAWVTGMALLLLGVERLLQGAPGWPRRALERLGTSSLSAYAVHQLALSRQQPVLGWGAYWAATAALVAFTYLGVLGVERAEAAWERRRVGNVVSRPGRPG